MFIDLQFDKGNGAIFQVEHQGRLVCCFVDQNNQFLASKTSRDQSFPHVFERYQTLIFKAAKLSIEEHGISDEAWGNLITESDLRKAMALIKQQSNPAYMDSPQSTRN